MPRLIGRFLKNESGATSIEYALIASLIAMTIITGVQSLGAVINQPYYAVAPSLK